MQCHSPGILVLYLGAFQAYLNHKAESTWQRRKELCISYADVKFFDSFSLNTFST